MRYSKILGIFFLLLQSQQVSAYDLQNWQIGFQPPVSPVMEKLVEFHSLMLYIVIAIVVLVFGLLLYVCIKFNKKANPIPSTTTHNTLIEIIWTVIPIIILVVIAIPSIRILYFMEKDYTPDMTIKVVGHQWYWSYQYPDHHNISFDSYIIPEQDLKPGQLRLLSVDNNLVVPTDTNVKVLITSGDVLHSWAVPSLGIKMDAIPGRTNEIWFRVTKSGIYYGQCSEICGVGHGFMPIAVEAVSKEQFDQWITSQNKTLTAN